MKVKHYADIIVGDYPYADKVKSEALSALKVCNPISQNRSNVIASLHTEWNWEPDNITFRNLKAYIAAEIEKYWEPGASSDGARDWVIVKNFWGNVYEKGDYAQSHCHKPVDYSFAYFLQAKWYDSPLIFTHSGKRIRPKEGRYVIFPAYLKHHVPKHRYKDSRITLSGNLVVNI